MATLTLSDMNMIPRAKNRVGPSKTRVLKAKIGLGGSWFWQYEKKFMITYFSNI